MCHLHTLVLSAALVGAALLSPPTAATAAGCPAFLKHEFKRLRSSEKLDLCATYAGKPLLIVNTASHCGYTSQFEGLEALYQKYRSRGLVILGFPSDDFNQEAGDETKVAEVCFVNYGVKFPMFAPSSVTGAKANPVFSELARQSRAPSWNFNKYLVSPEGKVVAYFGSSVTPESKELNAAIEKAL